MSEEGCASVGGGGVEVEVESEGEGGCLRRGHDASSCWWHYCGSPVLWLRGAGVVGGGEVDEGVWNVSG